MTVINNPILHIDIESPGTQRVKAFGAVVYQNGRRTSDQTLVVAQIEDDAWDARCVREFWSQPGQKDLLERWKPIEQPYTEALRDIWCWTQKMYRRYPGLILASDNVSFDLGILDAELRRVFNYQALRYQVVDPRIDFEGEPQAVLLQMHQLLLDEASSMHWHQNDKSIRYKYGWVLDSSDYVQGICDALGKTLDEMAQALDHTYSGSNDHDPVHDATHNAEQLWVACTYLKL